ncbi:cytochrome c [Roseivirga sp. E12]|uniref:c-type cytochrome n=1 Tax=Roseivirga sp. E12 TaxID=2819237 RepID=UPI001ABC8987|nr:cytochrome c [Roseivirga sp. E12]MBO3699003.1 cytochrome c [Roseivirga sp. E12]
MKIKKWESLVLLITFIFMGCGSGTKSDNEDVHSRLDTKGLQQFSNGKQLYTRYCQNCHMENGEGLGTLIPPLKDSDYLLNDVAGSARTIKYGLKGPIKVNSIDYNQPMPANPDLTSLEIQELLIYISNAWGNKAEPITLEAVENVVPNQ